MVIVETIPAAELQLAIQHAKDRGAKILALSPSKLKKLGRMATDFEVVSYVLATQA